MDADGEPSAPVSLLPHDLLPHIFAHVDVGDRCRARRVCRAWRAAALEPPHSIAMTVRLVPGAPQDAADPCAAAAAAALRSPLAAGLRRLTVALRGPTVPAGGPRRWGLEAMLAAAPAGVEALRLDMEGGDGGPLHPLDQASLAPAMRRLAAWFPRLETLAFRGVECMSAIGQTVAHPTLRRVEGSVTASAAGLASALPALRSVWYLRLGPASGTGAAAAASNDPSALAALADRGLEAWTLLASGIDFGPEAATGALSRILCPARFGSGDARPAEAPGLSMVQCRLPQAAPPEGSFEGIRRACFRACTVRTASLAWLAGLSRLASLVELEIDRCDLRTVEPAALIGALRGSREGLRIRIELSESWDIHALADACGRLLREPRLLRAVDLRHPSYESVEHCRYRMARARAMAEAAGAAGEREAAAKEERDAGRLLAELLALGD